MKIQRELEAVEGSREDHLKKDDSQWSEAENTLSFQLMSNKNQNFKLNPKL